MQLIYWDSNIVSYEKMAKIHVFEEKVKYIKKILIIFFYYHPRRLLELRRKG